MDNDTEYLVEVINRFFDRYELSDLLDFNGYEDVRDLVFELVKDGYLQIPDVE